MISSAAFPNVAFSSPPTPSPIREARDSVARPIQPASGMIPIAAQTKSAVWLPPPCQKRSSLSRAKINQLGRSYIHDICPYHSFYGNTRAGLDMTAAHPV
jgi:hypothetical protein